ncbi:MAG: chemotaxis protein CheW [Planctomycetes bacterium]|nr:chemotaxis protein CheW [Planctomycetota bacterium]
MATQESGVVSTERRMLVCRAGAHLCAIPIDAVTECMRLPPVEPMGGGPPFVLGVSVVRGRPTPVVSVAALLGGSGSRHSRLVTLRVGDRFAALAFDTIETICSIPDGVAGDVPPLLREAARGAVGAMRTLDGELLLVLDRLRLVPDEVWRRLPRGEGLA